MHGAINRQRKSRDDLKTLRKDAENLRASIINALSVSLDAGYGVVVACGLSPVDESRVAPLLRFGRSAVVTTSVIASISNRLLCYHRSPDI